MSGGELGFEPAALEEFVQEYMSLDRRVQRPKGIYSVLPGPREEKYQYTLQYLLDPSQPHGFGASLLDAFLECVGSPELNLAKQHLEIADEVWVGDDGLEGRIDLVICGGSALSDHPRWAVFVELKVGAAEGDGQTATYAAADSWNLNWFESDRLDVGQLDDVDYVYVKRESAEPPDDEEHFTAVTWSDLVGQFERITQASLGEYPHQSVIQLTDFIQSLKETENMDSPIDEDELTERLTLYFEHSELIQQVEEANSQFESDFEEVSRYLKNNWESELTNHYDFEDTEWRTSPSGNTKWQGILPAYWDQDPFDQQSTIRLYYRHSPTTECLRDRSLRFSLRLPPQRNVHSEPRLDGRSFNDVFTEKCTGEYADRIDDALEVIGVDETRLDSASALAVKDYPLDSDNLVDSYFDKLATAVDDFCGPRSGLSTVMNDVFEATFQEVFGESPVGSFPGCLPDRT